MTYVDRTLSGETAGLDLLGVRPRRTLVGLGYLLALAALVVTSTTVARATVGGVRVQTLTPAFDTLHWALIVLVVLSTFVVPVAYALYNGGPALSFLIAVCPELAVYATTGSLHLTVDVVLGVVYGAFAAVLALYAASYRIKGSLAPGRVERLENSLLFATAVAVVAVVAVARLYLEGPAIMAERAEPYSAAVVPTVALVAHAWATLGRG